MRVTWEDREAPDDTIWFEFAASPDNGAGILATADVSLLAAYPLAMWFGESRLLIEGEVTPRLADGARATMAMIAERTPSLRPVSLGLTERVHSPYGVPSPARKAALCMSGGVDALSAFEENRRTTAVEHPARYTAGLFVFGLNSFDFDGGEERAERRAAYEAMAIRLERFAGASGMSLTRVATNLRSLYPHFDAWWAVAHDTPLGAIGHALRAQFHSLAIASSGAGIEAGVTPHPLMDALLASHDIDVHAAQVMLPRLEKLRHISAWPEALAVLRVCLLIDLPTDGQVNCGRCEKCVRTMLQLLAIGGDALARAPFPAHGVTPDAIARIPFELLPVRIFYPPLVPLLAAQGRDDLADAIARGLGRWQRREPAPAKRAWWRIGRN